MLEEPVTSSVKGKSMDMLEREHLNPLKQGSPAPGLWPVGRAAWRKGKWQASVVSVIFCSP